MGGNDLIPFLLGIAWPQYLKLQEQHQKLHAGPGQGPGAGAPMGELSPEVAGILQMLMGQGGDPTGAPQPPAQPSPPLPPRIGPDSQNGLPPIPAKVIFPDKHAANQASKALQKLGMDPMTAYVCERSKSGHAHLTRKGAR